MANICYVEGKVWSRSKNKIRSFLTWLGRYKMLQVEETGEIEELEKGLFSQTFAGDCKWSIASSINNSFDKKGDLTSKTHDIAVELWSQEPGCGFEEHIIVGNGYVDTDECEDWTEYCADEYESIDELNEEFNTNFTEDNIDEYGYCHTGGFDNWGDFEFKAYLLEEN